MYNFMNFYTYVCMHVRACVHTVDGEGCCNKS